MADSGYPLSYAHFEICPNNPQPDSLENHYILNRYILLDWFRVGCSLCMAGSCIKGWKN